MRKYQRDQLVDILATLQEAAAYMAGANSSENSGLLEDFRSALDSVSGAIAEGLSAKRQEYYGHRTAQILEDIAQVVDPALNAAAREKAADRTTRHLYGFAKKLLEEEEIRTEIVFFPYKASMWDSMESIWLAARDDPACVATVVPIPYVERNADGTVREVFYEDTLFPAEVPVVHYGDYDLKTFRPDIAYIHNPYDEHNRVTSVAPEYYSHAIKPYVSTLVYVPYYVSDIPTNPHLAAATCQTAADIIVAANEEDRAVYMATDNPRQKVVALGSPKIDRILRMEAHRPPIPEAWKPALEGRTVVLLNTSLHSMLTHGEAYVGKIVALLRLVEESFPQVAILWRPHPLSAATLNSMQPALRAAYQDAEARALAFDRCVVDHTPDVSRAIALADVYIGDNSSSLVLMFSVTGKPALLWNYRVSPDLTVADYEEAKDTVCFSNLLPDGDVAWGMDVLNASLYRVDLKTGRAEYVGTVPDEDGRRGWRYNPAAVHKGKLLLAPNSANHWVLYDVATGQFEKSPCPSGGKAGPGYYFAHPSGTQLLFIPAFVGAVACYDLATDKVQYSDHWLRQYAPHITDAEKPILSTYACRAGDGVYVPSRQGNHVLEINVKTMQTTVHTVGSEHNRYASIAYDSSCFWLSVEYPSGVQTERPLFVKWDRAHHRTTEIAPDIPGFKGGFFQYLLLASRDAIWAMPYMANQVLRIDPKTSEVRKVPLNLGAELTDSKSPVYALYKDVAFAQVQVLDDHQIVGIWSYDNSLLFLDTQSGTAEKRKIEAVGMPDPVTHPETFGWLNQFAERPVFQAGQFLQAYLDNVPALFSHDGTYYRSEIVNGNGSSGAAIHRFITR